MRAIQCAVGGAAYYFVEGQVLLNIGGQRTELLTVRCLEDSRLSLYRNYPFALNQVPAANEKAVDSMAGLQRAYAIGKRFIVLSADKISW